MIFFVGYMEGHRELRVYKRGDRFYIENWHYNDPESIAIYLERFDCGSLDRVFALLREKVCGH